jgi:hypothetical protein
MENFSGTGFVRPDIRFRQFAVSPVFLKEIVSISAGEQR